jgi:hypothetical protein
MVTIVLEEHAASQGSDNGELPARPPGAIIQRASAFFSIALYSEISWLWNLD